MRSRRHDAPEKDDGFFIGTAQSYISLWQSISGSFFAVFVMVSSISAIVGGIVIMNVMLVSVTERTREIGVAARAGRDKGGYSAAISGREHYAMSDRRGDRNCHRVRMRAGVANLYFVPGVGARPGWRCLAWC